ncbi:MAG TPA: AMP-binding protein [Jatrophihabitans sp.]|nr:AMP-binding protein [Jatrophihabitans sp.]
MTAQHPPSSFSDLLRRAAAARGDQLAVSDGDQRLDWRRLAADTDRLAGAFAGAGLRAGDRVAIQAPSSAQFVLCYLAGLRAGLVVVPVNPAYTLPELEHILDDSGARALITATVAAVEAAAGLRERHPDLLILLAGPSGVDGLRTVGELLADAPAGPVELPDRAGDDLAVLLYTSGTSGRPKGAMLPVRALLANLDQFDRLAPAPVGADDRIFLPLPLFHIFGLNAGLGLALYYGASLTLSARFDAAGTLREMAAAGATVVVGAPLEYARWAEQAELAEGFATVRLALSGSAPLASDLVGRYAELGVGLYEGYGLTEAAPVVTLNLVPDGTGRGWLPPKAGSVGRPLPGVQVRLVDADGEPAEPGDLGFVEVRGQNLFTGYWPDGAGGPRADGWFGTGDLAVLDDDGDYYLVGRRSDLVLVNGFNVYPAEVEAVFARLPGVQEVAVLGLPDGPSGEVLVAYVVPVPGAQLAEEALLAEAARSLARFKLPRRVLEVDRLPYTATGKVMKWRLRPGEVPAEGDGA